jgi:hypothetical protein
MKKSIKYILMGLGAVMLIGIIGAAMSDSKVSKTTSASGSTVQTEQKSEPATATKEPEPASQEIEILQKTSQTEDAGGETMITVHVQVRNNTSELKDYVEVKATFYDKDGKIVGTAMGNTTNLAAGAKRTIDVVGMNIEHSAKYELEVGDSVF